MSRYLGRPLNEAHGAAADTVVLPELLAAMRKAHDHGREEPDDRAQPQWSN